MVHLFGAILNDVTISLRKAFCLVLRCLSDVLEGSSFIAVWSVSYFVMLLKNFVGVNYQNLRKVCVTSGPCTSTRSCFVLNGSPCLIELTRCGRKSNQPSAESEVRGRVDLVPATTEKVSLIRSNSDTHCLQTILLIFKFCKPQNKRILCFDSQ